MSYKVIVSLCTMIPTKIENLYSMIKKIRKGHINHIAGDKVENKW